MLLISVYRLIYDFKTLANCQFSFLFSRSCQLLWFVFRSVSFKSIMHCSFQEWYSIFLMVSFLLHSWSGVFLVPLSFISRFVGKEELVVFLLNHQSCYEEPFGTYAVSVQELLSISSKCVFLITHLQNCF